MNSETVKFALGDLVYSVLDGDRKGFVTGIVFRPGAVIYYIQWPGSQSEQGHYEFELSSEAYSENDGKENTTTL